MDWGYLLGVLGVTVAGQHTTWCSHRQSQEIELGEGLGRICYGSGVDSGRLQCLSTTKHLLVLRQKHCGIQDYDQCSPVYPYFGTAAANISKM